MSQPFMQLYVGDYLRDTGGLTTEQHGAYLLLLMAMWSAGGSLPNDARKLARFARCSPSRWGKVADDVLAFFQVEGDVIWHARLRFELEKAQEKSIKRAQNGIKGGRAKALKNKNAGLAIATHLPWHSSEPEPEPEREEEKKVVALAPSTQKRDAAGCRLPEDFELNPSTLEHARREGFSPEEISRELRGFRDYWTAESGQRARKRDWQAAFRTWLARCKSRRGGRAGMAAGPGVAQGGGRGTVSFADIYVRRHGSNRKDDDLPEDGGISLGSGAMLFPNK